MPDINPITSDQINISGNTFTLGATVAGTISTGVITSMLTNVDAGVTYNFAVVAFNNISGFSGWAGPVVVFIPIPNREPVRIFSWAWPYEAANNFYYRSSSYSNLIPNSNALDNSTIVQYQLNGGIFGTTSAIASPIAGACVYYLGWPNTSSEYIFGNIILNSIEVTQGVTYTLSFYHNISQGLTGLDIRLQDGYALGACASVSSPLVRQISPVVGPWIKDDGFALSYPTGSSGWQKFEFNVIPQVTGSNFIRVCPFQVNINRGSSAAWKDKYYYLSAFQLNEGSTASNFLDTGKIIIPEKTNNIYEYNSSSGLLVKTYDGSDENYINFGNSAGLTYVHPLVDAYAFLRDYKTWLAPNSNVGWTLSNSLKRHAKILKGLTPGTRAIYPRPFSDRWLWSQWTDKIGISGGGNAHTYFDENQNPITLSSGNSYNWGLWIENGVSLGQKIWKQILDDFIQYDTDCDYTMHNQEEVTGAYGSFSINSKILHGITSNPKYSSSYFGLTSWNDFMNFYGASAENILIYVYDPQRSYLAWNVYGGALFRKNLDLIVSGYTSYGGGRFSDMIQTDAYSVEGDGPIYAGKPETFGFHPTNNKYVMGNAPSPTLYGWYSFGWDTSFIYGISGSTSYVASIYTPGNFGVTYPIEKYPIGWFPFLGDMQDLRLAKRGTPNLPMVPVISSLRFLGQSPNLPNQKYFQFSGTYYISTNSQNILPNSNDIVSATAWTIFTNNKPLEVGTNAFGPIGRIKNSENLLGATIYSDSSMIGPTLGASAFGLTFLNPWLSGSCYYYARVSTAIKVTQGITYTYSFYHNVKEGSTGNVFIRVYGDDLGPLGEPAGTLNEELAKLNPIRIQQIQPSGGLTVSNSTQIELVYPTPTGNTWERFVFTINANTGSTYINLSLFELSGTFAAPTKPYYFGGFNLNTGTIANEYLNTNLSTTEYIGWYGDIAKHPTAYYADANIGWNPIEGIYLTEHGGNSAYFYELMRHACLHGAKAFNYWNTSGFKNATSRYNLYGGNFNPLATFYPTASGYQQSGDTTYLQDMKVLNEVLNEYNARMGGFVNTTHLTDRISYLSNYVVSGAPGLTKGSWWRVTIKPGTTFIVQGMTLPTPSGEIGSWFYTSGNTLTNITQL